jgi:predicted adenine nucleotide alpha hydrolase (AANH) superfamily ATPase
MEERTILVHACCGPCSTSAIERLINEGWRVVLYFPNSNIAPQEEADLRYTELLKVAARYDLEVIREQYDHQSWLDFISGLESEAEGGQRCSRCFAYNLAQAEAKAAELDIDHVTTTLTVSRFKRSSQIFAEGEHFERFEAIDFKKRGGFERSTALAKEMGLYRQRYCGCEFSQ